jgi:hypothetical protein
MPIVLLHIKRLASSMVGALYTNRFGPACVYVDSGCDGERVRCAYNDIATGIRSSAAKSVQGAGSDSTVGCVRVCHEGAPISDCLSRGRIAPGIGRQSRSRSREI